jgi:hypothetical protein
LVGLVVGVVIVVKVVLVIDAKKFRTAMDLIFNVFDKFCVCRFAMGDAHRWWIGALSGLGISLNLIFVKLDFALRAQKRQRRASPCVTSTGFEYVRFDTTTTNTTFTTTTTKQKRL